MNHVVVCHKWDLLAKSIDSTRPIIEVVAPILHVIELMIVKCGKISPHWWNWLPTGRSIDLSCILLFQIYSVDRPHRENLDIWMATAMAARTNVMIDSSHRRHLHGMDHHRLLNHSVCISIISTATISRMKETFCVWHFNFIWIQAPNDPWVAMSKVPPNQDSNNWTRMDNQNQERYDRTYNERNPKYIDGNVNASNSGNRQSSFINNTRAQDRYNSISNRFDGSRFN